ncbi:hypothetical protein R3P38DRAFT_3027784 [Favolaschia claudopus]|uniref:Fungal N-terminal domain-containing protein n=1 Tax=Favolaschia claudopus TaxID=2862362 RepID=A0AAW0AFG1_9AGAR
MVPMGTTNPQQRGSLSLSAVPPSSERQEWLAQTILTVKIFATAGEFAPFPYIRAAFGSIIIFLETVEKATKNREDLLQLCASIMDIVMVVQNEISSHGEVAGARMAGLCEEFIMLLRTLQQTLEDMLRKEAGVKGWLKEFLRAQSVGDQLERYRYRINELRTNFLLSTTLNTNLNVANIHKSISVSGGPSSLAKQFRHIALGDINLLYETTVLNPLHKVKLFTARVSGQQSLMTVARYQEGAVQKMKSDLEAYAHLRHPNMWQLFGFTSSSALYGLVFHEELLPLQVYRQFHRPASDLAWACIEGMLEAFHYHHWPATHNESSQDSKAMICVARDPVRLSLALPGFTENLVSPPRREKQSSGWHTSYFKQNEMIQSGDIQSISRAVCSSVSALEHCLRLIGWKQFFAMLVPMHSECPVPFEIWKQLSLGWVVKRTSPEFTSTPYRLTIPQFSLLGWEFWPRWSQNGVSVDANGTAHRYTFSPGAFKAWTYSGLRTLFKSSIRIEDPTNQVATCWLSQANFCLSKSRMESSPNFDEEWGDSYGVINEMWCLITVNFDECHHLLRDGTPRETHLFLPHPAVENHGPCAHLRIPESDQFYWSLDSSGATRLSQDECDALGIPRLSLMFWAMARFWHHYHFNAVREFSLAKGVNPYSQDAASLLGVPLVEVQSKLDEG